MTSATSAEGGAGAALAARADDPGPAPDDHVAAAALRCIARWGLAKTTLDDVAREAGCSRATVYRIVPGGKPALVHLVGAREIDRLLDAVTARLTGSGDAASALTGGIVTAARFLDGHEALATLLRHEPGALLPLLAFDRLGPLLDTVSTTLGPVLARHLDDDGEAAAEAVEWAARMVLSYALLPAGTLDLTAESDARRLVDTYLAPGLARTTPDPVP